MKLIGPIIASHVLLSLPCPDEQFLLTVIRPNASVQSAVDKHCIEQLLDGDGMNVVLGHDSALVRLYWAGDNRNYRISSIQTMHAYCFTSLQTGLHKHESKYLMSLSYDSFHQ